MQPTQHESKTEEGIFTFAEADVELIVKCRWTITRHQHFLFVGIVFEHSSNTPTLEISSDSGLSYLHKRSGNVSKESIGSSEVGSTAALEYLIKALHATRHASSSARCLGGLILPSSAGYIVHSDIVPLRLVDYEPLYDVVSFSEPLGYFPEHKYGTLSTNIPRLLSAAAGGFFIRNEFSTGEPFSVFGTIQSELLNRLSFSWTLAEVPSIRQRTLVIVYGLRYEPEYGDVAARIYPAARALGLRLIVLDEPGHWLENGKHNHLRESFIPISLALDSGVLANRIVEALRGQEHRIGGIVSFSDQFATSVAKAAELLSLPTLSPKAYMTATSKYETIIASGRHVYRGNNLEDAIAVSRLEDIPFPMIVKPSNGWCSEGIYKVENRCDLVGAVSQIDFKRHGTEFVMEEFCAGPEVNLNMVLYNGELLFYEVSDDHPNALEGINVSQSFVETETVVPSHLPDSEQLLLRRTFHELMLRIGLTDGVFNVEGRVKNSSMEYRANSLGLLDLRPRQAHGDSQEPSAFLHEINPRPPGTSASVLPELTYGVNLHALAMLIALRDSSRVAALAHPFPNGAQYYCVLVNIANDFPPGRAGVWDSDDICKDLKQRRPDLAKYISACKCLKMRGDLVPDPSTGVNVFVAYYNVFSRISREHALEIAKQVRQETRYSVL